CHRGRLFPQDRSLSSPIAIVALLFGGVVLGLPASLEAVNIRWSAASGPTNQMVEVLGLPRETLRTLQTVRWSSEQWQKLLAVYADQGDITTDLWLPPMAGEYEAASESLRFRPRFPLEPAVSYRA